ncbi:hypothetical protein EWM64_g5506 [Hericium alpestre]|uniref:Arrestin C-terminal-like domain-containing protein n=1 Tax=Hericium alpestre TaxID=135208 RepID=A0A4Y9ZYL3_9AGAM|nr:hypothetical protein EWM64_g5506 [Hericium alpestre]
MEGCPTGGSNAIHVPIILSSSFSWLRPRNCRRPTSSSCKGILESPPGAPDRPQAAVKGAIEVRMGPQGVKAKYVRIELRKIETLPGGGTQNSFFDYVGQSPINLWQSSEEFSMLQMKEIPFYIRIPESIPPSLTLEKGAGVKYELVGQMCVQGKSGFLRRNKSIILTSSTPIIIDKHELHSTWPIYQQPESRDLMQDAVVLTVERTQNCYGPGDRVAVHAIVKSDSLHTVILRGFEFTLKETTIFRVGPHSTGKKAAPQVKINIIGDQKMPVNATLYGGTSHKAQLSCMIPQSHTTATLTSARHIDINYVCIVKALMGTGKPLITELPVIVSNWPRYVSTEAIRRIGNAATLTLQPPTSSMTLTPLEGRTQPSRPFSGNAPSISQVQSMNERMRSDSVDFGHNPSAQTMPNMNGHAPQSSLGRPDEFGLLRPATSAADSPSQRHTMSLQARPRTADSNPSEVSVNGVGTGRRQRASTLGQMNRFTIVNALDDEIPEEDDAPGSPEHPVSALPVTTPSPKQPAARSAWLSAEEEKARLYQQAKAEVERTQNRIDRTPSPQRTAMSPIGSPPPSSPGSWPTAEEEKVRLFNQAQNNARILQSSVTQYSMSPPASSHTRGDSRESAKNFHTPGKPAVSAGAALYSAAISSMSKQPVTPPNGWNSRQPVTPPHQISRANSAGPLPSAEEEKEMLRRYQYAKHAVSRHQEAHFGPMDSGMSSFPSAMYIPNGGDPSYQPHLGRSVSATSRMSNGEDLPPPWVPSSEYPQAQAQNQTIQSQLSEKERYRQAYEARDAIAAAQAAAQNAVAPTSASPPPMSHPPNRQPMSAAEEKELLRRQYAAQETPASPPPPVFQPAPPSGELRAQELGHKAPRNLEGILGGAKVAGDDDGVAMELGMGVNGAKAERLALGAEWPRA